MTIFKVLIGLTFALLASLCITACSEEDDTLSIYNQGEPVNENILVSALTNEVELKFNIPIEDITDVEIGSTTATASVVNDALVILFPKNDTDEEICIPVTISYGNKNRQFNIIQKVKNKVESPYPYYSLSCDGEKKVIEVSLTSDSKCSCIMVYDGEMFASIDNYRQDGKHISIELDIAPNSGMGRACGVLISPEDGDNLTIGLWQQPHIFTDNETFEVYHSGQLGVMLGDNVSNYTHLQNVAITGSLNANDMAVIKKLFNKYTYGGFPRPLINLDLSRVSIAYSDNKGYYERFGGIGSIWGDNQVQTTRNAIPSQVFQQSDNLVSIMLPSSVTDIKRGAFQYCMNLESVSLPIDCKRIDDYVFFNCSKLTHIETYYKSDYSRITSIGDYAFSGIGQLDYLILPEELTGLTPYSLVGFNVYKLYVLKQTPPDINIYGISKGCTLFVPKGCVDIYRNSMQWGKFTNIREITDENLVFKK
ncbi:MAG: leucine-rich repeat domain-containing protein [Muribaculaceae bacterium]|nr:leucine-rich repeat domain-containing protein [Muribaculaceae bacterium]